MTLRELALQAHAERARKQADDRAEAMRAVVMEIVVRLASIGVPTPDQGDVRIGACSEPVVVVDAVSFFLGQHQLFASLHCTACGATPQHRIIALADIGALVADFEAHHPDACSNRL